MLKSNLLALNIRVSLYFFVLVFPNIPHSNITEQKYIKYDHKQHQQQLLVKKKLRNCRQRVNGENPVKQSIWADDKFPVCNYNLVCVPVSPVELWKWLHNSFTVGSVDTFTYKAILALKMKVKITINNQDYCLLRCGLVCPRQTSNKGSTACQTRVS